MGCAPSIHVSQSTGVVYCREDSVKDSHSLALQPLRISKKLSVASLSISELVSHIPGTHRESLTTEVRITRYQGGKRDSLVTTTTHAWVSAEGKQTQTESMDKVQFDSVYMYIYIYINNISSF